MKNTLNCGFCGGVRMVYYYGWRLSASGFPEVYAQSKPCPRCCQPTKRAPDEKPAGASFTQKLFAAFRR